MTASTVPVHDWKHTTPVPLPNLCASLQEIESLDCEIVAILPGFQATHKLALNTQALPAYIIVFRSRDTRPIPRKELPAPAANGKRVSLLP